MRKCHLNTCPVGIATQNPELRKKFNGRVKHLVNYFHFLAQDLREIMASVGVKTVNELVGRSDLLETDTVGRHWKSQQMDLSGLLKKAIPEKGYSLYQTKQQKHGLEDILDRKLIKACLPAIENQSAVSHEFLIESTDRAVGTMLSNEVAKKYGSKGLPADTIKIEFKGSAGQSFGAFLAKGINFQLTGESNDYFGKGLSGGSLTVLPDPTVIFNPHKNIIIGNVALYGATSGEVYIQGMAGDRFCVRNSGAQAVVEGIGDNGCEYMTGGKIVVLGRIGKNFAAGMSGGIAYLYQPDKDRTHRINPVMVDLEKPGEADLIEIKEMIKNHFSYSSSSLALDILNDWYEHTSYFIKVIPKEYKAALKKKNQIRHIKSLAS